MLQLSNVTKTYGPLTALHETSLSVAQGRTTVLIGPSGCGKSTTLRLMNGLIRPDTGTVRFRGQELTPANVTDLRHHMGYVIQEGGLFPHLTARNNIALLARHLKWSAGSIDLRIGELCELTRFPRDGLRRYPSQLSGGQRQRVSLMRALMLDPDVLLLDEPLGALDPMIRADLQTDLREIFRTLGKTVVMVTHDLSEAGYFGDTIVLMRAGRIIQRGGLDELATSPADDFVTRFINAQRGLHERAGGAT